MDEAGAATSITGRAPHLAKYELLSEVGHGATATVFRARDRRLGREVAVKVVHPHLRDSVEVRHRFAAEARTVAQLRHRNIVDVYDVSEEDENEQYLVCELLSGNTLRHWIRARAPMPPEVVASIGIELLEALALAHGAGVIHRDVKPENVLVDVGADGSVSVKLADFGIAKILDMQGVTATAQVLGSPAHMAPEQIEAGEVDGRSDLFGVGVLLYECMVGHLPFEGKNPAQVLRRVLEGKYAFAVIEQPQVGKEWSALLDRALAGQMSERFQSADDMREALLAELTRLGVPSSRALVAAWCAEGAAFDDGHRERMVARLCVEATARRMRGDPLGAAADLSRALAYDPDNTGVRRQMGSLLRRRTFGRRLRIAVPLILLLGTGALGVKYRRHAVRTQSTPSSNTPLAVPLEANDPAVVSAMAATDAPPVAASTHRPKVNRSAPAGDRRPLHASFSVAPQGAPEGQPHAAVRGIEITMRPPFGVFVATDGESPVAIQTGAVVHLDDRAHSLRFTCANDVCRPLVQEVPAGEGDTSLNVKLVVKPATLVVDADGAQSFVIRQKPGIVLHGSTPQTIPMDSSHDVVLVESVERGKTMRVELFAGQTVHAAFSE